MNQPDSKIAAMNMFRVGLTGGIACGKTTIVDMFAALGVHIIDTDELAREVLEPGEPAMESVIEHFGSSILDDDGRLDRRALRRLVFSDPEKRRLLEQIVHPVIRQRMAEYSAILRGPYQIMVIPLLVESKSDGQVDRVLVVDCDEEVQIRRLMNRDHESRENAEEMMATQISRQDRLDHADDIIDGESSLEALQQRVKQLDQYYRELATSLPHPGP
ncbi:MAG: dephospho-CoA kinase [Gammaproteobacteria bacterium]|nr:dephospho-CoA kinase [Gammaproteobacteria bacterium]MCZ6880721.1 dephospho-CoA kinase [Gammaproteobacteria bacterium]